MDGKNKGIFVPASLMGKQKKLSQIMAEAVQEIEEEERPAFVVDPETFDVKEIYNCVDPQLADRGIYDKETNILTVYLAPHQQNFVLDKDRFLRRVGAHFTEFRISQIGAVEIDEEALPACKYFIPSKKQVNSELPDSWRYTTGFIQPSCVCPTLGFSSRKPGQCKPFIDSPDLSSCSGFEPLREEAYVQIMDRNTQDVIVTISKKYNVRREVTFVSDAEPDKVMHNASDIDAYANDFDQDLTEVRYSSTKRESYFQKVFAE